MFRQSLAPALLGAAALSTVEAVDAAVFQPTYGSDFFVDDVLLSGTRLRLTLGGLGALVLLTLVVVAAEALLLSALRPLSRGVRTLLDRPQSAGPRGGLSWAGGRAAVIASLAAPVATAPAFFLLRPLLRVRYDHPDIVAIAFAIVLIWGAGAAWLLGRWALAVARLDEPRFPHLFVLVATPAFYYLITRPLPWLDVRLLPVGVAALLVLSQLSVRALLALLGTYSPRTPIARVAAASSAAVALVALGGVFSLSGSPTLGPMVKQDLATAGVALDMLHDVYDLDGDGAASILGGGDCNDRHSGVGPHALEIVGNGVDDNCLGGDLPADVFAASLRRSAPPAASVAAGARQRPIIVLTIDSWRADRFGANGGDTKATPHLDRFAEGAAVFTNAYAAGASTSDSLPALWSSAYPLWARRNSPARKRDRALPEVLLDAGWETAAVHPVRRPSAALTFGFHHGFADQIVVDDERGAEAVVDRALEWLRSPGRCLDAPCLLWVHTLEPHAQYLEHEGFEHLGDDLAGRYDQEVAFADRAFGRFLDALDDMPLGREATVVLASDHGEGLGELGNFGHAVWLWESVIRVPLAIRAPGVTPGVIATPVSLIDVAPTLGELHGLNDPEPRRGRSLAALLRGEKLGLSEARPIFAHSLWQRVDRRTVVKGPWKLHHDNALGAFSLVAIDRPGLEGINQLEGRPEVAAEMLALLGRWWDLQHNDREVARQTGRGAFRR
jgi:arylsulfatase A-like enzyme